MSAFAFHFGVKAFLGIKFYAFLPLIMLIDLPLLRARLTAQAGATQQDDVPLLGALTALSRRALLPAALVGGALFLGQVGVAVARIETWPVALHPVFGERSGPGKIVHDHKIALEPQQGRERDLVYVLSKRGGGNGFKRTMLRFDRDVSKGIPRQKTSREIVQMLRDNGLEIVTGDHIAIYKTSREHLPDRRARRQGAGLAASLPSHRGRWPRTREEAVQQEEELMPTLSVRGRRPSRRPPAHQPAFRAGRPRRTAQAGGGGREGSAASSATSSTTRAPCSLALA